MLTNLGIRGLSLVLIKKSDLSSIHIGDQRPNVFTEFQCKRPSLNVRASLRHLSEEDCEWVGMDTEDRLVDHRSSAIIDDLINCDGICHNRVDQFGIVTKVTSALNLSE